MPSLKLNGVDILTLGLRIQNLPGFDNSPSRGVVTANGPGVFGSYLVRTDPGGPRKLQMELFLDSDTVANRIIATKQLKAVCESGLTRIELDAGGPLQVIDGVLDGEPSWSPPMVFLDKCSLVRLVFTCPSPLWHALNGRVVALAVASTRYPLQIGTGPSPLIIRIAGAATTPSVIIRDAWGNIRHKMDLPTLLVTNDFADIDTRRGMVEKVASNVRTNILNTIPASVFISTGPFPFSIDQTYGDYRNGLWPTAETSAGTGEVFLLERFL